MSHQASAGFHVSEQFTTLTLVGGRDCIPGALLSHQSPDLWVKGGAIIEKTICVGGNIIADGYIIGNTCADVSLTGKIQEKYLNEGINIKGDIRDNCGNIYDVGYLSVQTIAASNACGQGNIIYMGNDVRIFGDLEVGANLIVYQDTILERELHVVGQSFFSGNMIAGHIDAVSICTPLLECVQEITGPGTLVIAPNGNITNIYGKLNVDDLCVAQDTYFFGNVYGLPPSMGGVSTFSAGTTGFLPNAPTGGAVVLSGTLNAINGGTGQNSFVIGDLLYADTATTLARLADVAVGSVLASNGVGVAPVWSNVTNAMLANSSLTVTAGSGLSGGGSVSLGGTVTLTNAGVTSAIAGTGISVSASTGAVTITNTGVTSVVGGSGISVSASNGSVTITSTGTSGVSTFSAGTTGFSPNSATAGAVVLSGTLNAVSGGTGQSVYVVGDLLYADTTTTIARLADVAIGSVLASNGVGAAPVWSNVTNTMLANSSLTVTAGSGLSGGGSVSLGGTVTLSNAGVTSAVAGTGISVSASTGAVTITNTGVTSVIGGSGISVSASNGSVTITSTGTSGVSTFSAGTTGFSPNSATAGAVVLSGTLNVANGGTGLTATPTNGQIPIGTGTGYSLNTITAGSGISISNGSGTITITSTGTAGVTSFSAGTTGFSPSVATSGAVVLTGTLNVANGGTGLTATPTNGQILVGNGSGYTLQTGVVLDSAASPTYPQNLSDGVWYGLNTKANSLDSSTITIGNGATTNTVGASSSIAMGVSANANGANGVAIGSSTGAGVGCVSVGLNCSTSTASVAIGSGSSAVTNGVSIGFACTAGVSNAIAIGSATQALQNQSISIGAGALASLASDVAFGPSTTASGGTSIALGTSQSALSSGSISIGNGGSANGNQSIVIGQSTNTTALRAIAVGNNSMGLGTDGIAVGRNTTADTDSVAVGANANQGIIYSTGTASQSGGTVTGSGTNFLILMINGVIIFSTGEQFTITGFTDPVTLSVSPSTPAVPAGTSFQLYYTTADTVAVGANACLSNRAIANTGIGYNSLSLNQHGTEITSVGYRAMYQQDGSYSTSIGASANYGDPYSIGTASQTGNTVTGVGTTFTAAMKGGRIIFANNEWATLTTFVSATQFTVSPSQTVSSQSFTIYFGASSVTAVGYASLTQNRGSQTTAVGYNSLLVATSPTYITGTAGTGGVSSVTVLGSGTSWFSQMAQGTIVFAGGTVASITSVTDRTTMIVSPAVTIANGTSYTIYLLRSYNTGVGVAVGGFLTTGASNTLYGTQAGVTTNGTNSLVSGCNNTLLGAFSSCYPTNDETIAIGYKAKANETGSISIGAYAVVNPTLSYCIAIGYQATVSTGGPSYVSAIAIGSLSTASSGNAIAIGNVANANGVNAISVGFNTSGVSDCVSIGNGATCSNGNSIAIGSGASCTFSGLSVAIGANALAANLRAIAIGSGAQSSGNCVAIGGGAIANYASGGGVICIGQSAGSTSTVTSTTDTILIGSNTACVLNGGFGGNGYEIAIGSGSIVRGASTIAIGRNAAGSAGVINGIAIGESASATGSRGVAIRGTAAADSIAIGGTSAINSIALLGTNGGGSAVAIGSGAVISVGANDSIAIGESSSVTNSAAIAIGSGAVANIINSIALGTGATTNTVAGGSAGLAITVPTDTLDATVPGAATDTLVIMINGTRYKIALTAFP